MDPAAFGGTENYLRETSWVADLCRQSPPPAGKAKVRLPGELAAQRRRQGLADGLALYPGIMAGLESWATKMKVDLPKPI
jgi:LDH2 family malate/lactate/ureidoglycolate dehydrogenase